MTSLDDLAALLALPDAPDLDLVIEGKAITKGSGYAVTSRSTGKALFLLDNAADQKRWATIVRGIAREHLTGQQLPLAPKGVSATLHAEFVLARFASTPQSTPTHTAKPDVDKLARCLLDALAGLVYADDAQINDLCVTKRYAEPGEVPHVRLRVWTGSDDPDVV